MYSKKNDIGTISVGKNVIGTIVSEAVKSFDGKLILCNSKGKVSSVDGISSYFLAVSYTHLLISTTAWLPA